MKYLILIFVIGLISCNRDEMSDSGGKAAWELNSEVNQNLNSYAKAAINYDSLYLLTIALLKEDDYPILELGFSSFKLIYQKQIPATYIPGSENIFNSTLFSYKGQGDILGNSYILNKDDAIEDYLILTSIDTKSGKIEGEFQASFYVDTSLNFDLSFPDTIIIKKGTFKTTIKE